MIFEDCIVDHNASRERIGMGLLLAKYLQNHKNERYYEALNKYVKFVKREWYGEETGYVYTVLGKDGNQLRLYDMPWVAMLFAEMYYLTKEKVYLSDILKLFEVYYKIGGKKFYPNAVSILRIADVFKCAEMKKEYERLIELFKGHVSNMVTNGTSYPKHEVNYEQTIVAPAATIVSEFAELSSDEKYKNIRYNEDLAK